jgi:hypothetical protein
MSHPGFAPRVFSLLALGLAAACTAAPSTTFNDAGVGGTGAGNGTGGETIIITGGGGSGNSGTGGNNACAAEPHQAQQLPLDMYIMLDQSGSMDDITGSNGSGPSKWDAVSSALKSFIQQPSLAGISVGIQFFPVLQPNCPVYCQSPSDTTTCGSWGPCVDFSGFGLGPFVCQSCYDQVQDSCAAADYAKPEVEIALLPGVASKIVAAIDKHGPATATPTEPALQGAITHAQTWLANHAGHAAVAVLATDGLPTECGVAGSSNPTQAQIQSSLVQIAQQGLGNGVKTFTIGIFAASDGPDGKNLLNAVSQAGGTGQTFTINTGGNVNQQFLDALNKIRGAALGCNYSIPVPQSGTPDYTRVNVQYTPGGGGNSQVFPYVASQAQCAGDGWYYDNAAAPKQIILCPSTCTKVVSAARPPYFRADLPSPKMAA